MKKLVIPAGYYFVGLLFFVLQGVFVSQTFAFMKGLGVTAVPHLLLVFLVFYVCYAEGSDRQFLLFAFSYGLIFDMAYSGVVGVYAVVLPFVVMIVLWIRRRSVGNTWFPLFFSIVAIAFTEAIVYFVYLLIAKTDMYALDYLWGRFLPTIGLNIVVILVLSYPLMKLSIKKWGEVDGFR